MPVVVDKGWLWLNDSTDYLKLACKQVKWDRVMKPSVKHYANESHYGYDLKKRWIVVKAIGVIFDVLTEFEDTLKYLDDWNDAGAFTLEIVRDTSDNKIKLDGVNTSLTVLYMGAKGNFKEAPEDGVAYRQDMLIFEQAG